MVEADDLLIGAGGHVLAHVPIRHRLERLRDGHQLIAADLRLTPQRDVIGGGGRGPERGLFLRLEVFPRTPLRATMRTPAVVLATPLERMDARVLECREDLAGETIIADAGHRSLEPSFWQGIS